MGVEEVADELYGLAPGAFVAARTLREKEARSAGDRDLAGSIRKLGKPSTAAWLVNQLVREHPGAVLPLLDLGAGLRVAAAALDGPQLRELDRQQYQLLNALVGVARTIAAAAGQPVSPDTTRAVEDTVRAALADDGIADLLRAGRLTEAQHPGGFPFPGARVPAAPVPAAPVAEVPAGPIPAVPAGAGAAAPVSLDARREARQRAAAAESAARADRERADRERAARLRAAEQDEDRRRQAVQAAGHELARARAEADRAEQQRVGATTTVDRLRTDLDAALSVRATAEADLTAARTAVEVAERAARAAHRGLVDAGARSQLLRRSSTDD